MLLTVRFSKTNLSKVKDILESTPDLIGEHLNYKHIIVDTGASRCCTGFKEDFVEVTLKRLVKPLKINGIKGSCKATHEGTLSYELVGTNGGTVKIKPKVILMENLRCRIYSPKSHFKELHEMGNKKSGYLEVSHDHINLKLPKKEHVVISHNEQTLLPILQGFKSIDEASESLALLESVTCETN